MDGTSRAAARALGNAGVKDYQNGDFSAASEKLERAYSVARAPAVGLWSARALAKLGKLVEAAERYLEVTRLDVNTGDPAIQRKAQVDARKERAELLPRIPSLIISVQGAETSDLQLTLDGNAVPLALVGQTLPVNPGIHVLEGRLGDSKSTDQGTVEEGGNATLTLTFHPPARPAAESAPPERAPATGAASYTLVQTDADGGSARLQKTLGWVALSVGGAGLVTSGLTLGLALGKKSDLGDDCSNGRCSPTVEDEVESYSTLRTVSTVGAIVGIAGVGGGLALLLTSKRETESTSAVVPWIGLGSAGVTGTF